MQVYTKFLNKEFDQGIRVIKNLTMKLERGLVVLLGPKGSGKSTLMKMMATLEIPTNGTISFDHLQVGRDDKAIRGLVGYLPQGYRLYHETTPRDQLRWMSLYNGIPNHIERKEWVSQILKRVGLLKQADFRVHGLSFGQHRRLGLAVALVNAPSVLLLDAPFSGLDNGERSIMRDLLDDLSREHIVIMTSGDPTDPIRDYDELIVLLRGQLRFRGRSSQLVARMISKSVNGTYQAFSPLGNSETRSAFKEAYEYFLASHSSRL